MNDQVAGISYITVSVANMEEALAFWTGQLGMELRARRNGADAGASALLGVAPDEIAGQAVIGSPGAEDGRIYLVQFAEPGEPVRLGSAPTDLGPKNLDINCTDMPARMDELKKAGYAFRSDFSEYELNGLQVREVQMPGHDGTNIVFIEVAGEQDEFSTPFSDRGYAAVTSFVIIVPDTLPEAEFYRELFGFDELLHHRLSGPEIEAVVGLPPGAALELRMLGRQDSPFGRVELVSYEGAPGANLFAKAHPPATGILGGGFVAAAADGFLQRAEALSLAVHDRGECATVLGNYRVYKATTPAGFGFCVLVA